MYFLGTLLATLDSVLTTKRRLQLRVRALTATEVAVQLASREPVYGEHVRINTEVLIVGTDSALIEKCLFK